MTPDRQAAPDLEAAVQLLNRYLRRDQALRLVKLVGPSVDDPFRRAEGHAMPRTRTRLVRRSCTHE
jgi:hypothetical protein